MMRTNNKIPRFSSVGVAAKQKQKRDADLDRMERNKELPVIFVRGFGFRPFLNIHDKINIQGPLCPSYLTKDRQCLTELSGSNAIEEKKAHCVVCGKTYDLPHNLQEFKTIAHSAYDGFVNSQAEIITLDVPYEAIKAESEDDTRKIRIKWSQKDGRNQAVIYFIKKGDNSGEKAHIFVDVDREEIRYDSGDVHPEEFLAKITAEFKGTKVDIKYREVEK